MDTTQIGVIAAELMESIEEEYGSDATIGVVGLVVEVDHEHEGQQATAIDYRCSDPRRWIQGALFKHAERAALARPTE